MGRLDLFLLGFYFFIALSVLERSRRLVTTFVRVTLDSTSAWRLRQLKRLMEHKKKGGGIQPVRIDH
jgi:hypothetical protein